MARPRVVLPLPLSPTRPRLSPFWIVRETLSTAWMIARLRAKRFPEVTGNWTERFWIWISGGMVFELGF